MYSFFDYLFYGKSYGSFNFFHLFWIEIELPYFVVLLGRFIPIILLIYSIIKLCKFGWNYINHLIESYDPSKEVKTEAFFFNSIKIYLIFIVISLILLWFFSYTHFERMGWLFF